MNKHITLAILMVWLYSFSNAQTIIPSDFYGTNAWMPDSIGSVKYWGDLHDHWSDLKTANVKMVRVGGIASDKNFYTNYQIINMIDSIRNIGAEPLIQIPLWGGDNTAADAATIVEYINITHSKAIKYWSIGNEPNLVYNSSSYGFSSGNYTYSDYATDVKTFSIAMKTKDASIKIVAGELAWYYTVWVTPLLTAGGSDDITGNDGTHDYIDYFSFHAYPFSGNASQTRAAIIEYVNTFKNSYLSDLKTKIATANTFHTRNNPLQFAVTELNVDYKEPSSNETDGVGSKSFIAGQWWADMLLMNAENGCSFVNFWSVVEGGAANPTTDHGFIDHDNSTLRPTYYHFQLCSKFMTDTIFATTDNQDSVRAYVSRNADYGYSVMILNYDTDNSFSMRLRLNTDAISGSETLQINADANLAKEITETIPANTTVLMFLSPNGHYIGNYIYSQANAMAGSAPSFSVYQATRAKKVYAHYLPWFDVDGSYNVNNTRVGWCHEGDCTDAANKSSVYTPLIGEYTQFDDEVLKYHIRQAIAARIDGFIININPTSDYAWKLFHKICDATIAVNAECGANDFGISISFDNSTETDLANIIPLFQVLEDSLYNHTHFKNIAWKDDATGKPVLVVWSEADWADYRTAIDSVFGQDEVIAIGRNMINFDLFDANMEWINYLTNDQSNTTDWGEQAFQDSDWTMARQESRLTDIRSVNAFKLGGVYPGFDDRNVPSYWNGGNDRYFARDVTAGEVMELTWNKHINYTYKRLGGDFDISDNWIQIITWNDFPEGTSVEPSTSAGYGYTALQTNRKQIATFKNASTTNEDTMGIYVPYAIYQAIKAGRTSDANTALTYFCNKEYNNAKQYAETGSLPVELLAFSGHHFQQKNILEWQVGEMINHAYFEIEHSLDGRSFEKIGVNHLISSFYAFEHLQPASGMNYYRLKQMDYSGEFQYSNIIAIATPSFDVRLVALDHQVKFITPFEVEEIHVFNAIGQEVSIDFNGKILHLDTSGVYWLRFKIKGAWQMEKVLIGF